MRPFLSSRTVRDSHRRAFARAIALPLEPRQLLSTLAWTNRGVSDGFDGVFGTRANLARGVVDAVLNLYGQIIVDLNNNHSNRLDIAITMNTTGTGHGGSGGPSLFSASGVPQVGNIWLERGNDANGDGLGDGAGYYLDPVPTDSAEFNETIGNAFLGGAPTSSDAYAMLDLYNLVAHEVGHVLGFGVGNATSPFKSRTTYTGIADTIGYFYTFNGPSISHLLSSANGGADGGSAIHAARADLTPITYNGTRYDGCYSLMNWFYVDSARRTIDDTTLLMLKDAYGYTINLPQKFGTYHALLNRSNGELLVRGDSGISDDTIVIDRYSDRLRVSVDLGIDVPATGALPGNQNLPAFVSDWQIGEVSSIRVAAGHGNDSITVRDLGYSVGTNGFFRVPMTINGGVGTDSLYVDDYLNRDGGGGGIRWQVTNSRIRDYWAGYYANGYADYAAFENLSINGGALQTWFAVDSLNSGVTLQLFGNDGNDSLFVCQDASDIDNLMNGEIYFNGGAGTDEVIVYDIEDTYAPTGVTEAYTLNSVLADILDKTGESPGFGLLASAFHESFTLYASPLATTIDVNSVAWGTVSINAGAGNDTIRVGGGDLDQITGVVTINGDSGTDALVVDDSVQSAGATYDMLSATVRRSGRPDISHSTIEAATLCTGTGNDTVYVSAAPTLSRNVECGAGSDRVYVDTVSHVWSTSVTVNGGGGTDSVVVDDSATSDYAYSMDIDSMTDGYYVVGYDVGVESISLATGIGRDSIRVDGPFNAVSVMIDAGADPDSISIGTVDHVWRGSVTVTGGAGSDSLLVDDSGYGSATYTVNPTTLSDGANVITHSTMESVQLLTGIGVDQITANQAGVAYSLHLNAGDGNDAVSLVETSPGRPVLVDVGIGSDTLRLNLDNVGMAQATFESAQHLAYLEAGTGARLTLAPGGAAPLWITGDVMGPFATGLATLDLNDNIEIFDTGTPASLDFVQNALTYGYAGGSWTGPGYTSTVAATDGLSTGIGYVVAGSLFGSAGGVWHGYSVSQHAQLLSYTLYGDTDLNRTVNFDDLLRLAQNYNSGRGKAWFNGDCNYDKLVDFDDLLRLAQTYGNSLATSDTNREVTNGRQLLIEI
jgi:hypothetical protein